MLLQVKGLCAEPAGRWWLALRSMTQPWDRVERTTKVWVRAHRSARVARFACSKMSIFRLRLQVGVKGAQREKCTLKEDKNILGCV